MAKSKKSSSSTTQTTVYSTRVSEKTLNRAVKKKGSKGLTKIVKEAISKAGK